MNQLPFVALKRLAAAFTASVCLAATPAFAHPHVFTAMRTSVMVNAQSQISGVRVFWTFDEIYSQFALEDMDTDKDGTFSADEIRPLTEENIKSLAESNYFVAMRQANKTLPQGAVTEYGQTLNDGKLTLSFVLPLAQPIDPKSGEVQIKVYDPDFFIAFDYFADDPVKLEGTLAQGCAMHLKALPTDEELDQTRAFLSDKGAEWQPENNEDFGSMFAQSLQVTCA